MCLPIARLCASTLDQPFLVVILFLVFLFLVCRLLMLSLLVSTPCMRLLVILPVLFHICLARYLLVLSHLLPLVCELSLHASSLISSLIRLCSFSLCSSSSHSFSLLSHHSISAKDYASSPNQDCRGSVNRMLGIAATSLVVTFSIATALNVKMKDANEYSARNTSSTNYSDFCDNDISRQIEAMVSEVETTYANRCVKKPKHAINQSLLINGDQQTCSEDNLESLDFKIDEHDTGEKHAQPQECR